MTWLPYCGIQSSVKYMHAYTSDKKTHVALSVLVIVSRFLAKTPSIQFRERNPHTYPLHPFIGSRSCNMYPLVCQFEDTVFWCMCLHVMPFMTPQLNATYYSNEGSPKQALLCYLIGVLFRYEVTNKILDLIYQEFIDRHHALRLPN